MTAEALDRILIAERIARYGRAVDERDLTDLAACFTDDLVWEGVIMGVDQVGPHSGHAALAGFLTGIWAHQTDQRRHAFTNAAVDRLDDTTATASAYLQLWSSQDGATVPITTGAYRLDLIKRDGVWLIRHLVAEWDSPFGLTNR